MFSTPPYQIVVTFWLDCCGKMWTLNREARSHISVRIGIPLPLHGFDSSLPSLATWLVSYQAGDVNSRQLESEKAELEEKLRQKEEAALPANYTGLVPYS